MRLDRANGKEEMTLKGQKGKAQPRKAVSEGKGNARAKEKTKTVSNQTRAGTATRVASGRKKAGTSDAEAVVRREIGKGGTSRSSYVSPTQTTLTAPSVEKVRKEAKALGESGPRWVEPESQYKLPTSYGNDRIVAMSRDPYWVHVYWEITEGTMCHALQSLGRAQHNVRSILRVYTRDGDDVAVERVLFDIFLTPEARNWYINVGGPGRTYRVDIGLLTTGGKFVCLARSNAVSTPRDRMSDVLDEKWMSLSSEYEEMYALSGGLTRGVSSPELHERLARELQVRLASPLFSPGVREVPGEKELAKPFWFIVDADLIVYGATVPGSALKVNGGDWHLREDGTFSFRCHLPDGTKEISVSARSADDAREEHVKLKVNRGTRQTRD
jgi:hypothetical protein